MNTRRNFGHVFGVEVRIAAVVFGLIVLTLIVAMVWSRLRRGHPPEQKSKHPVTESVYVVVVACLVVFLIVFSLTSNSANAGGGQLPRGARPAVQVKVTAFQWCWRFDYQGSRVSVTAPCINGDIPTMVVPAGEPVRIALTSDDVVHEWWVPYLRYKVMAYPYHTTTFSVMAPAAGSYPSRCAEFCGLYHYAMDFTLKAVPPAQYQRWLRSHQGAAP